jgi:hypothetical protein
LVKNIDIFNFVVDKDGNLIPNTFNNLQNIKEGSGSLTDTEKSENKINILVI